MLYVQGINHLRKKGFIINAIVCDGRKGLINSFKDIPVQMCQFHQAAIIRRYLTRKPRMKASIELKKIVKLLTVTDKESFNGALKDWYKEWEWFLKERTTNEETGKTYYTHKKLRSAYNSLKRN